MASDRLLHTQQRAAQWPRRALLLMLACVPAWMTAQPTDVERVKSAFIFHFVQLVDWDEATESTSGTTSICAYRLDPMSDTLAGTTDGKMAGRRVLRVRQLRITDSLQGCRVLYVGREAPARLDALLQSAQSASILTIGEGESFLSQGGVIAFVEDGSRLRFEVSLISAQRSHVKVSARLLLLALRVIGGADGRP